MRKPRITKQVRDRLQRLLPMEYRPDEIAAILGITKDTLYRGWIPAGAPQRRDATGNLWLMGTELATWLRAQQRQKQPLAAGEAFCFRCQVAVVMQAPFSRQPAQYAIQLRGYCPNCGAIVTRLVADDQSPELA